MSGSDNLGKLVVKMLRPKPVGDVTLTSFRYITLTWTDGFECMHLLQERVVNQCVHSRQFLSHSAHTNTKKKMYVQWSSSEAAHSLRWMQLSDFQSPTAFDLQRSAMSGVREALVCFVRVLCVCCCNRTKDSFVHRARGCSVSSKHCALHVFSCVLNTCVPFLAQCLLSKAELHSSVFTSPWSAAFAPGLADFGPPAFRQTPLAFLSSGYHLVDFCSG